MEKFEKESRRASEMFRSMICHGGQIEGVGHKCLNQVMRQMEAEQVIDPHVEKQHALSLLRI